MDRSEPSRLERRSSSQQTQQTPPVTSRRSSAASGALRTPTPTQHQHLARSSTPPDDPWREKKSQILAACASQNLERLRELAVADGGLITDEIRRQAWPLLLGCPTSTASPSATSATVENVDDKTTLRSDTGGSPDTASASWQSLPPHRDEEQVRLDVDRSFIYYPNNISSKELDRRKAELSALITEVLRRQPYLCYFQGYHDICQVFLLVLLPHQHYDAVSRLSVLRIRDFMLPNLVPALAQLRLIPAILKAANPTLNAHLSQTQPFFALSGTLTMYAHDIQTYGDISRLFDALLARDAVFSVYLFAQIVLSRAEELFDTPATEPEILHSILSKLPQPLALDQLISDAVSLCKKYPPESLPTWRSLSPASVLKTTRLPPTKKPLTPSADPTSQTVEQGERLFEAQVRELRWAERKEQLRALAVKYRRPARAVSAAVLVALLSYYLRKSEPAQSLVAVLCRHLPKIWRR